MEWFHNPRNEVFQNGKILDHGQIWIAGNTFSAIRNFQAETLQGGAGYAIKKGDILTYRGCRTIDNYVWREFDLNGVSIYVISKNCLWIGNLEYVTGKTTPVARTRISA